MWAAPSKKGAGIFLTENADEGKEKNSEPALKGLARVYFFCVPSLTKNANKLKRLKIKPQKSLFFQLHQITSISIDSPVSAS